MIHKQQARVPRNTLLIGFAYSLTRDGSPGSYNTGKVCPRWAQSSNGKTGV
jgi:hypothetical protein